MWVQRAVCGLLAFNVGSLAAIVGSQARLLAPNVSPKQPLFAGPGAAVCRPLQLADAETAAREAMDLDPQSYYPYNLLGAIHYQRGLPEAGERYFDRARELGSSPHEEDEGIQSA